MGGHKKNKKSKQSSRRSQNSKQRSNASRQSQHPPHSNPSTITPSASTSSSTQKRPEISSPPSSTPHHQSSNSSPNRKKRNKKKKNRGGHSNNRSSPPSKKEGRNPTESQEKKTNPDELTEEQKKEIQARRAAFFRKLQVERENYRRTAYECMRIGEYEHAKTCFKHFCLDPSQTTGEARQRELDFRRDLIMCRMNCSNTYENLLEGLQDVDTVLKHDEGDVQLLMVKSEFLIRQLDFSSAIDVLYGAMMTDMRHIETAAMMGVEIEKSQKSEDELETKKKKEEEELPNCDDLLSNYIGLLEKRLNRDENIPPKKCDFDVTGGNGMNGLREEEVLMVVEQLYGRLTQIGKQHCMSLFWTDIHEAIESEICHELLQKFELNVDEMKPFLHQILDWNIEKTEYSSPFDDEKESSDSGDEIDPTRGMKRESTNVSLLFIKLEMVTLFARQLWGDFSLKYLSDETRREIEEYRIEKKSQNEIENASCISPTSTPLDPEMDAHIKNIDTLLVKASIGRSPSLLKEENENDEDEKREEEKAMLSMSAGFSTYMVDTGLYGCRDGVDLMSAIVWTSFEPSGSLSCLFDVCNSSCQNLSDTKLLLNEKWLTRPAFPVVKFLAMHEPPNVHLLKPENTSECISSMDASSWNGFMRVRVRAHLGVDPDLSENHVLSRDAQEESKMFEKKMVSLLGKEKAKDLMQRELDMSIPLLYRYAILMSKISGIDEDVLIYELTLPDEQIEESSFGATATLSRQRLFENGIDLTNKLVDYKPIGLPSLIQTSTFNIFPSHCDESKYDKNLILEELRQLEKSVVQFHIDYKRVVYEEAGEAKARELERVMNNLQYRGLELTKWLRNFVKFMIIRRDIEQDILDVSGKETHLEGMKWFDECTNRVSAATSILVNLIGRKLIQNAYQSFLKVQQIEPMLVGDLIRNITTSSIEQAQALEVKEVESSQEATQQREEADNGDEQQSSNEEVVPRVDEQPNEEAELKSQDDASDVEMTDVGTFSLSGDEHVYETIPARLTKLKQMVSCYQRILRVMNKKFEAKDGESFERELMERIGRAKLKDVLRLSNNEMNNSTQQTQERLLTETEKAELHKRYNTSDVNMNDVLFELEECKKALCVDSLVVPIICTEMSSSIVEKSLEACRQHESASEALKNVLASAENTERHKKEIREYEVWMKAIDEFDSEMERNEDDEETMVEDVMKKKTMIPQRADKRIIEQYIREQGLRYRVCMDRSNFVYNHLFVVIYCVEEGIALTVHTFPTNANKFEHCARCTKVLSTKRCDGCGIVHYCSRDCQVSHWKNHAKECRLFQTTGQPTCFMRL